MIELLYIDLMCRSWRGEKGPLQAEDHESPSQKEVRPVSAFHAFHPMPVYSRLENAFKFFDCRYKDSFQIKSEYFERKVAVNFWPSSSAMTDGKENIHNREYINAVPPKAHPKPTLPPSLNSIVGLRDSLGGNQTERASTPDSLEVSSCSDRHQRP